MGSVKTCVKSGVNKFVSVSLGCYNVFALLKTKNVFIQFSVWGLGGGKIHARHGRFSRHPLERVPWRVAVEGGWLGRATVGDRDVGGWVRWGVKWWVAGLRRE